MDLPLQLDPAFSRETPDEFVSRKMVPFDKVIGASDEVTGPRHRVENLLVGGVGSGEE
jgi:hypothetical protein